MCNVSVQIKGKIFENGNSKSEHSIIRDIKVYYDDIEDYIIRKLDVWKGNFALIIETKNKLICITDHIRSYPILIDTNKSPMCVFKSDENIQKTLIDSYAKLSFFYAGYTLLDSTLLQGVISVPAGHIYFGNKETNEVKKLQYFSFQSKEKLLTERSEKSYIEELHSIYIDIFKRII